MPDDNARDAEAGTFTLLFVPLKLNAVPNLPVAHAPFATVPVFPLPDASATVVPALSPNEYAATNPEVVAAVTVVE